MPLHIVFGCMLLAVLLFRLAWGVWGAETARFARFVRSPAEVAAYGRGLFVKRAVASEAIGHNPMGGWSVAAMLGPLIALTVLGLFCVDEDDIAPARWPNLSASTRARRRRIGMAWSFTECSFWRGCIWPPSASTVSAVTKISWGRC